MTSVLPGRSGGDVDTDRILAQPLYSSLSRPDAESFAGFSEGGLAVAFFVIESGEAEAVADGHLLRNMGPGDWFGEIAIVGHSHRTATVRASSPLTVIVMTAFEFRRLEAEHPEIAETITRTMQERLGA